MVYCLLSHRAVCITVLFLVKLVNLIIFLFSLFAAVDVLCLVNKDFQ